MDSKIAKLCELLTIPDSIKDDDILAAELIKIDEVFKVVFKLLKEFHPVNYKTTVMNALNEERKYVSSSGNTVPILFVGGRGYGIGSQLKGHSRQGDPEKRKPSRRDSLSAFAIGLSGLAMFMFGATFPTFAPNTSHFKTEFFNQKAVAFLNRNAKRPTVDDVMLSEVSQDSESDLDFPDELPVGIKRKITTPQLEEEIAFIKKLKEKAGGMDWALCLSEAHESDLFKRYYIGSSLRSNSKNT
ncbi:hypothetical protein HPULCUR_008776 [Helicostylum pulchrum]|uniref:Uncharacterized protein n=1 Tax=Helicostylum pulchrum TaxID=562976 RepID=A0ABP9Y8K4_9FUNG